MTGNKIINKKQNRTETNEIVIMNFSGIYKEQQFYRNRAEMQEDISWVEVQDLPGSNCYCDEEAQNRILDEIKKYAGNGIHFIDSGNYHYVSRLWISKDGNFHSGCWYLIIIRICSCRPLEDFYPAVDGSRHLWKKYRCCKR